MSFFSPGQEDGKESSRLRRLRRGRSSEYESALTTGSALTNRSGKQTKRNTRRNSYQGHSVWWSLEGIEPSVADVTRKLEEDQVNKEQDLPRMILHPQSRFRVTWDFIVLGLLLYFMFSVPFRLCFLDLQTKTEEECLVLVEKESCDFAKCTWNSRETVCHGTEQNIIMFWWDSIVDIFFAIDIILNFRTAYIVLDDQANQKLVSSSRKIARRYVKSWFLFDLAGSLPFDLLLEVLAKADPGSNNSILASLPRLLRFAKVFRLLKLARAARIGSIVEKLDEVANIKPEVFQVAQYLFLFSLVAHVLSCILFALGTLGENFKCLAPGILCTEENVLEGTGVTWISNTVIVSRVLGEVTVQDAPVDTQYMMSMYWAITIMTTVGFGDIGPVTAWEVGTVIFAMLIGATTFSYVIGNMASLISKLDGHAGEFKQKMDQTTVFMHVNSVPKDLKNRIRKYYDYSFNHPQVDLSLTPLSDISPALRLELLRFFRKDILANVSLFRAIQKNERDRLLSRLLECIVPIQRGPGDHIFQAGELGKDVLFLISGEVDMIEPETREIVASLRKGSYFGENALIPGQERRTFTVRSRSWCDMLSLSARDLKVVLQNYPESECMIRLTARLRWARLHSTIEAHQVVSRARARAALVTGETLIRMIMKTREDAKAGLDEDEQEDGEMMLEEDRNMSRQEAELLGDLRATVLASGIGRQLVKEVREVKDREWDWSRDWVDGESILEEARELVRAHGTGAMAEKALVRKLKDDDHKGHVWSDDMDFGAFGKGSAEGGEFSGSPGLELEKSLLEAVQRLEAMEKESQLSPLNHQIEDLNSYIAALLPKQPSDGQPPEGITSVIRAVLPAPPAKRDSRTLVAPSSVKTELPEPGRDLSSTTGEAADGGEGSAADKMLASGDTLRSEAIGLGSGDSVEKGKEKDIGDEDDDEAEEEEEEEDNEAGEDENEDEEDEDEDEEDEEDEEGNTSKLDTKKGAGRKRSS